MNATEILSQLNGTWNILLEKYYDKISDEFIKHLAKENNLNEEELHQKAAPLKKQILSIAKAEITTNSTEIKKGAKKHVPQKATSGDEKYDSMSRKDLIALCQKHGIPKKRKNLDMIALLQAIDAKNTTASETAEEPMPEPESEPELEEETAPTNTTKLPSSNELEEETISDDED